MKLKKILLYILSLIILIIVLPLVIRFNLIDESYENVLGIEIDQNNNTFSIVLKYIFLFFPFYFFVFFILNLFLKVYSDKYKFLAWSFFTALFYLSFLKGYIPYLDVRNFESDFYVPMFALLSTLNPATWLEEIEGAMNVVFYIPIYTAFIIIFPKIKDCYIYIMILVIPFLVEGVQYAFAVGSADMGDITYNLFGSLVGIILFKTINLVKNIITKNI